eukprot:SAG31_NODE_707_length_12684_cov_16.884863_17_plen_148_part_00
MVGGHPSTLVECHVGGQLWVGGCIIMIAGIPPRESPKQFEHDDGAPPAAAPSPPASYCPPDCGPAPGPHPPQDKATNKTFYMWYCSNAASITGPNNTFAGGDSAGLATAPHPLGPWCTSSDCCFVWQTHPIHMLIQLLPGLRQKKKE